MGALDGVLDVLESGLARNGEALLAYARAWRDDGVEREVARAAGAAYVRVLVPFLRRAIVEGVFGVASQDDSDAPRNGREGGASALRDTVRGWEGWLSEMS